VHPVVISESLLWVLQAATILVVVGLARQVGVLHLRVPPRGAGPVKEALAVGTTVELAPVTSLESRRVEILSPGRLALVVFANPGCSLCSPILEGLRSLARRDASFRTTVAVDGDPDTALGYAKRHGFGDAVAAESLDQLDPSHRPFAIALSSKGTVLGSGVPNTLEQLEVLLADARHAQITSAGGPEDVLQLRPTVTNSPNGDPGPRG
jgi:methylamine dehydrogenase accessory protein MauD